MSEKQSENHSSLPEDNPESKILASELKKKDEKLDLKSGSRFSASDVPVGFVFKRSYIGMLNFKYRLFDFIRVGAFAIEKHISEFLLPEEWQEFLRMIIMTRPVKKQKPIIKNDVDEKSLAVIINPKKEKVIFPMASKSVSAPLMQTFNMFTDDLKGKKKLKFGNNRRKARNAKHANKKLFAKARAEKNQNKQNNEEYDSDENHDSCLQGGTICISHTYWDYLEHFETRREKEQRLWGIFSDSDDDF